MRAFCKFCPCVIFKKTTTFFYFKLSVVSFLIIQMPLFILYSLPRHISKYSSLICVQHIFIFACYVSFTVVHSVSRLTVQFISIGPKPAKYLHHRRHVQRHDMLTAAQMRKAVTLRSAYPAQLHAPCPFSLQRQANGLLGFGLYLAGKAFQCCYIIQQTMFPPT